MIDEKSVMRAHRTITQSTENQPLASFQVVIYFFKIQYIYGLSIQPGGLYQGGLLFEGVLRLKEGEHIFRGIINGECWSIQISHIFRIA